MSNNAAERELRAIAVGRRNWTFAGSDEGGRRAAAIYTLIATALCRARHKAVYAARRTMPNGLVFPRIRRDRHVIGSA
jgi:transposase